jgi:hypothetical protein
MVIVRVILSVVAGVVAGTAVVFLVESLGHRVFPPPAGLNPSDPESIRAAMAKLPIGALLAVLVAWIAGSFAGGWLAALIARRVVPALIVGFLILAASAVNLIMIPHPVWFAIAGLLVILPAAWLGGKVATRGQPHGAAHAA